VGDETDIFFAEPQAPAAGPREQPATALGDGDDDGWFERAASDALAGDGGASPCGEAIGAAALAPDRELVARTTRRHRRPRAAASPVHARRHGGRRGLGRLGAGAAGCVLLVLTLALVTNRPASSSPDARPNRSAGNRAATPPRASRSTPTHAPRAPAAAAARARSRPVPRRSQRTRARTPKRTVRDRARRRPARRVSSPTSRVSPATPPPAAAPRPPPPPAPARPAVRRPRPPATSSFVPGDLPPAR